MMLNVAAYRFVALIDPDTVAAWIRDIAAKLALKGTVLIAPEGINLFLAGEDAAVEAFLDELRCDPRFDGLVVKRSQSSAVPFGRLKVKRKREIITFGQPDLVPAQGRAPSVSPETLARWIVQGRDDQGREFVLLDTRNRQEVELGTFEGALTLPIVKFTELPHAVEAQREAMAGRTVVSFCTGGIRCEKSALWMARAGFERVFQLEGGILNYFERVGRLGYRGECFVFDERVALNPELEAIADSEGLDAAARDEVGTTR